MNSLGGPGGLKKPKGKIRPPMKPTLQTPLSETWTRLAAAIREIQRHNSSKLSYEEQYRYAYNMVLYKQGDQLYSGVKVLISDHLLTLARSLIVPSFPRAPLVPTLPTTTMAAGSSSSSSSAATGASASAAAAAAIAVAGVNAVGAVGSSSSAGGGGGEGMSAVERGQEGERFLKAVKGVWDDHISCMGKIRDVLKYMDKVWTPAQKPPLPLIYDAGLTLFLVKIVRSAAEPIHDQLISTLLSQIRLEREGEVINRSAVRDVVQILLNLSDRPGGPSVYELDFEAGFLAWTAAFYRDEGERLVEDMTAGDYLRRTERRLEEEASRTQHYLSNQTSAALQRILQDHLLTAHLQIVLTKPGSGLVPMVDGDNVDDLARLYRLFGLVPTGHKELRQHLKDDVRRRGEKINAAVLAPAMVPVDAPPPADGNETAAASTAKGKGKAKEGAAGGGAAAASALQIALRWVQEVLDLKDKLDALLVGGFGEDRRVQTSINEAFELFINANPKSAEYISLFIDDNLKKGLKGKSEEEVDVVLDKTITLFRFLTDKDVFERYYKNHLSKRLINGRSVSDDAERGMVAKLKIECGYQFTQKLEGMFMDIRVSTDTMDMYKNHVAQTSQQPPFELAVTVLTATFWPGVSQKQLASFPPALAERCTHFEKFYHSRHSGRRLTWQTGQGTADVRVRFTARTHELNVSTLALIVLLLFEELDDGEELGYEDIQAATQIPHAELARTLQSLACGKYRVLTKFPKGREVATTDTFAFNDAFTAPLVKIKIAMVASKVETTEERIETNDKVMEDRRHMIEACIVRIMKSSKRLKHSDLLQEVIKQLAPRFAPTPSDIKKRIEALIERDYLDREADLKTYTYLA